MASRVLTFALKYCGDGILYRRGQVRLFGLKLLLMLIMLVIQSLVLLSESNCNAFILCVPS